MLSMLTMLAGMRLSTDVPIAVSGEVLNALSRICVREVADSKSTKVKCRAFSKAIVSIRVRVAGKCRLRKLPHAMQNW